MKVGVDVVKTENINIRISIDDKKIVQDSPYSYADIFDFGIERLPSKMMEKADYYQKMYQKCKHNVCTNVDTKYIQSDDLDALAHEYIKTGRSVNNPVFEDRMWLTGKLSKNKIKGDYKTVLEIAKELKGE